MTLFTHCRSGLRPAMSMGSVMFSSAVSVGSRLNAWKMKPILSLRSRVSCLSFSDASSTSPIRAEPAEIESSPAMQCISVDLPEPDGPMMAVKRALPKSTETESSATTRVSPCP